MLRPILSLMAGILCLPVYSDICVPDRVTTTLCVEHRVERVISLSPHITELVYSVGSGGSLVGTIEGSDFPPEARSLPIVGDYSSVSIEKIVSLKPDLVIAWSSSLKSSVEKRLKKFSIPLYHSDPATLDELTEEIRSLARLTGNEIKGIRLSDAIKVTEHELRKKYSHLPETRGILLISDRPLMALSNAHAVSEAFDICSVKNIVPEDAPVAATINREYLLGSVPKVIFTTFKVANHDRFLEQLGFLENTRPDVVNLNPDLLLRQTPRMLDGIREMCEAVHTSNR